MKICESFNGRQGYGRVGLFLGMAAALMLSLGSNARAQQAVPLHVVRVGHGDVAGLKNFIQLSVDACRVAKHLPPGSAGTPSDAYLAKLEITHEEEFFDGQMWANYVTQKQVSADGSSGCTLAIFVQRTVEVQRVCTSRITGDTAPLAELADFESPSGTTPEVFESALSNAKCKEKPLAYDLSGLPRESVGATQCVWNGLIVQKEMAAHGMKADLGGPGHDMCLYAAQPMYYYQGVGHPVILKDRTVEDAAGNLMNSILGATKAMGNTQLDSFTTGVAIDPAKFGRAAVEAFVKLPSKISL